MWRYIALLIAAILTFTWIYRSSTKDTSAGLQIEGGVVAVPPLSQKPIAASDNPFGADEEESGNVTDAPKAAEQAEPRAAPTSAPVANRLIIDSDDTPFGDESSEPTKDDRPSNTADSVSATPTEAPSKPDQIELPKSSPGDALDLEVEMAESAYLFQDTFENRVRLVLTYEKLIERKCFHDPKRQIRRVGGTKNLTCLSNLEKLLAFYPDSAIGICAKIGLNSTECHTAFEPQIVSAYSVDMQGRVYGIRSSILSTDQYIKLRERPEDLAAWNEVRTLVGQYQYNKTEEHKQLIYTKITEFLKNSCQPVITDLTKQVPPAQRPKPTPVPSRSTTEELQELLSQMEKGSKTGSHNQTNGGDEQLPFSRSDETSQPAMREASPSPLGEIAVGKGSLDLEVALQSYEKLYRIRYIPQLCQEAATVTLQLFPDDPVALCQINGELTPICQKVSAPTTPVPGSTQTTGGLATF